MSVEFRANLPNNCIQDKWNIEKDTISLADNSSQTILEQVRVKFKLAESTVYYDFSVVDSLCHEIVIGRNLLTVIRSEVSLPGGGIEVFCGNPLSSCEYVKIPPGNECIIPVAPWHPVDEDENSIYCSSAVTAPVIVESCINKPGAMWWLKVVNPLEETQKNDFLLGFAEKCTAPEVDEEEIEEFLDLEYLSAKDTPIALCRVAVEIMKHLTNAKPSEDEVKSEITPNCEKDVKGDSEKIQGMDPSESCLDDEQKQTFRNMLLRNRQSLAFTMKELGQCEIAPMKIKVDESQGIVSSRPYRYSPQKMDISMSNLDNS